MKKIQARNNIWIIHCVEGRRTWRRAGVWHKFIMISFKKGDIPRDLLPESWITQARSGRIPEIKYSQLDIRLLCDVAEPGGIVLNWVGGNDGESMLRR